MGKISVKTKPVTAWGFMTEKGTYVPEAFKSKNDAIYFQEGNKSYKLVRVQIMPYKKKQHLGVDTEMLWGRIFWLGSAPINLSAMPVLLYVLVREVYRCAGL